jgi:PIN domain
LDLYGNQSYNTLFIQATEDINATEIYLVIDTNVFIQHLLVLRQALTHINADVARLNVVMLVPGIVVSELDYQKNSTRKIANDSRKASSWLAGEIGNGTSRVSGQAYTQTLLPSGNWRQRSGVSLAFHFHLRTRSIDRINILAFQ